MKKFRKITILTLLFSLVFATSCKGKNDNSTASGDNDDGQETIDEEEVGVLKNYLTGLDLKGYLGNNLKNNARYWQKDAYLNNPNIITQIAFANSASSSISLSSILGTDYFSVDSYYDIDIKEKDNTKYIGWTLKYVPSSFGDRDIRFSNDPDAKTYWPGCKELWIHVNNSEINDVTGLRVCFEDDSQGRESFNLIQGKTVKLYTSSTVTEVTIEANGYVSIPANFDGYIAIPFDNQHYECYWCEGGNRSVDITNVAQFQIAVKTTSAALNKTFYLNDFAIVGNIGGDPLPQGITHDQNYTYKVIWDISNVGPRINDSSSQPSGLYWYGEFVGKLLTGIAFTYKATKDGFLVDSANTIIENLKEAQGEDGYLGVFKGNARYSIGSTNWDLWNQYHCIVGLAEWYKITGNQDALDVAKKALDCIYNTFKNRSYLVNGGFETNRGIAHGYALMYQITKEQKYLDESERIIMQDCQDANGWYKTALRQGSFYRSSSARWEVLHMIMTLGILFEETQKLEYYEVMEHIWYDIQSTDIHNTGGFTTNEGAIGDPYRDGVIETCCTIAWCAFTNEFYKYSKAVEVVDELERSYYNGILGALLDDDKYCTYNTPQNGIRGLSGGYDGRRVKSQQDISFQYNPGSPDMNCCQANFARGIGQISEWACLTDGPALYLNYFGNCNISTQVNGVNVTINEVTSYPVNGNIKLTIKNLEQPSKFVLKIRIPSWSEGSTVTFNGKTHKAWAGQYFEIVKTWKNGDEVDVNLGMRLTGWYGDSSQAGYSSIYYGPILFALDEYYLNKYCPDVPFKKTNRLFVEDFQGVEVKNGNTINCWVYMDVPFGDSFIRLIDFASAGKYNGQSTPSSYYSWLLLGGFYPDNVSAIDIWKIPLLG